MTCNYLTKIMLHLPLKYDFFKTSGQTYLNACSLNKCIFMFIYLEIIILQHSNETTKTSLLTTTSVIYMFLIYDILSFLIYYIVLQSCAFVDTIRVDSDIAAVT